jgi:hypothetical protein
MNTARFAAGIAASILITQVGCSFHRKSRQPTVVREERTSPSPSRRRLILSARQCCSAEAADSLQPGDTLEIGPGTYAMDNSLFIPSGVTVRGRWDKPFCERVPEYQSL